MFCDGAKTDNRSCHSASTCHQPTTMDGISYRHSHSAPKLKTTAAASSRIHSLPISSVDLDLVIVLPARAFVPSVLGRSSASELRDNVLCRETVEATLQTLCSRQLVLSCPYIGLRSGFLHCHTCPFGPQFWSTSRTRPLQLVVKVRVLDTFEKLRS